MRRKAEVTVCCFHQSCLEDAGATMTPEQCDAIAAAWSRASLALRTKTHGHVTAIDTDGEELVEIILDFGGPTENGQTPLIHSYKTLRATK